MIIVNDIQAAFAREGYVRPDQGRLLGGVCAGLGRRFGFEPWQARLLFVLILLLLPGSQILIYPILWILMPSAQQVRNAAAVTAAAVNTSAVNTSAVTAAAASREPQSV